MYISIYVCIYMHHAFICMLGSRLSNSPSMTISCYMIYYFHVHLCIYILHVLTYIVVHFCTLSYVIVHLCTLLYIIVRFCTSLYIIVHFCTSLLVIVRFCTLLYHVLICISTHTFIYIYTMYILYRYHMMYYCHVMSFLHIYINDVIFPLVVLLSSNYVYFPTLPLYDYFIYLMIIVIL